MNNSQNNSQLCAHCLTQPATVSLAPSSVNSVCDACYSAFISLLDYQKNRLISRLEQTDRTPEDNL